MPAYLLHVLPRSAPCRAALLTLEILRESAQLDVEVRHVDLRKGEHRTQAFLALNPLHTVPTLEDTRSTRGLRESRAIMRYLCELSQVQDLYPPSAWARAQVDALLDWDVGSFYKAISARVYPEVFREETPDHAAVEATNQALDAVAHQLEDGRPHLTGERITLADLSIATGVTMLELVEAKPFSAHPAIAKWVERLRGLSPWSRVNEPFEGWKRELALV